MCLFYICVLPRYSLTTLERELQETPEYDSAGCVSCGSHVGFHLGLKLFGHGVSQYLRMFLWTCPIVLVFDVKWQGQGMGVLTE